MDVTYKSLPKGAYIRLLEVRVDSATHGLVCEFKVVSLEPCMHNYTALSYAWEDPKPVGRIQLSDGSSLPLSDTLSKLFESLQRRNEVFPIWIDALCINQKDDDEKASQVSMMGKVYSCARQVLLWLGDSDAETGAAYRFMKSKKHLSWPEGWDKEKDLSGLDSMFAIIARPWFQRVWVIQEVTLSENVCMMCGDDLIDFNVLRLSIFAVWKFCKNISQYGDESHALNGLWCVTRLFSLREEYQATKEVRYEILLQAAFHCQATDKRDMVFAFKGIADRERPVPQPEYTMSAEDIFTKTAIALLCHGTTLDLLALCGIARREESSNLPTWVPDLRLHSYDEPFVLSDGAGWEAGGVLQASPVLVTPEQLRLHAQPLDIVKVTCPVFDSNSVATQKEALEEILKLRKRIKRKVSKNAWLDIVAQSLTCGLDIEEEPMEYGDNRGGFNEWLHCLQASSREEDLAKLSSTIYHRTMGPRVDGWKAFLTRNGHLCIGPPAVSVGDALYTVPGCLFPLVLRQDPKCSASQPLFEFILVSWCFVHGVMLGEEIEGREPLGEILLR